MFQDYPRFSYYTHKRLHIGICGSVAAYKIADLMRRFQDCGILVSVTLTPSAQKFISPLTFEALGASIIYTEMFKNDSPFAHLEPGQVADAMLIAPASAATLSRLSAGAADEMLACQALAFDGPIMIAPAMNPKMWVNPATVNNVETLIDRGYFITEPVAGMVACQDTGTGRLADLRQIYLNTLKLLTEQDLFGKKVLVTLGPTQEKWDAVRVWTNNSTGSMGTAFALAAWLRGAEVHVVAGPVKQFMSTDENFFRYDVTTANEMYSTSANLWDKMDIGIFTAAVADFKPDPNIVQQSSIQTSSTKNTDSQNAPINTCATNIENKEQKDFAQTKFKKENHEEGFSIAFSPNKDILKALGTKKSKNQKIIGFAAESDLNVTEIGINMHKKLISKHCDIMVGNFINEAMGSEQNRVFVATHNAKAEQWPVMPKTSLAWDLLSHLNEL